MKNFNLENAQKYGSLLLDNTTFDEQMWIFRNITYDQVKYFSANDKGVVYDGNHSNLCIEQANQLQRQISTCTDLFTQAVSQCREQNKDYLKQYDFAGPYLRTIEDLKSKLSDLEETIEELHSKIS